MCTRKGYVVFLLALLTVTSASASSINPAEYSYLRPIIISSYDSLTDYQVKVSLDTKSLISAGKMRSDCADTRFTDSDKLTLLWYWIESACNTPSTIIWVRVPAVSKSQTIYLYYGKPQASSGSDGANTFPFFDDFESSGLDQNKWPGGTCYTVSGGSLHLSKNNNMCYVVSKTGALKASAAVHYRAMRGASEGSSGPGVQLYSHGEKMVLGCAQISWGLYDYYSSTWFLNGLVADNSWHVFEMAYGPDTLNYAKVDSTTVASNVQYDYNGPSLGYMQLYGGDNGFINSRATADSYFDYIFVRNYNYPEPTAQVQGEEATPTTTSTTTTTTTTTPTTTSTLTTSTTTTTRRPSDICVKCCIAGNGITCHFRCDEGPTDLGITDIQSCSYNSNYLSIRYSGGLVSQTCSNGYCIDYVSPTSSTTSTASSTTTTSAITTTTTLSTTTTTPLPATTTTQAYPTTTTPSPTTSTTLPAQTTIAISTSSLASTTSLPATSTTAPGTVSTSAPATTNPVSTTLPPATLPGQTTSTGPATTMSHITTTSYSPATTRINPQTTSSTSYAGTQTSITIPQRSTTSTTHPETEEELINRLRAETGETATTTLPQDPLSTLLASGDTNLIYIALGGAALLGALLFLFLLPLLGKKRKRDGLLKEYYELQQKTSALRKVRKNVMHEYYTRKISEDEARKRILDTEQEIIMERTRMEKIMKKLGMSQEKAEENSEIIEWISEKLSDGVDPETIKTALADMSLDPELVDTVKKTFR